MARNVQLLQLVSDLKAEIGMSTRVNVGVDKLPELKARLARVQETLYDAYDWPFLRILPTKDLQSGQRYYDMPTDMNVERIEEVSVWYGGVPHPLKRGIGMAEYAQFDSASDVRSSPALRWDIRWTGTAEQIEIWPVPDNNDMYIQITGIRKLRDLVANSDVCDIDDKLIVLHAAAQMLARQKSQDAQRVAALAEQRFSRLKGRLTGGDEPVVLGQATRKVARTGPIIRVR